MSLPTPIRKITLCYVTDRRALAGSAEAQTRLLLQKMENAARSGVDWIQIREKDLTGRELAGLVDEALRRISRPCRILVNDRLDVATAVGAGGVHLGEKSMPIEDARRFVREKNCGGDFLVGMSAHSLDAAQAAEKDGADYVIFGPVYQTPSKAVYGPPQGLERLTEVCGKVAIPVIAIGGITFQNTRECTAAGASGIAAIRLFQDADDPAAVLRELRAG